MYLKIIFHFYKAAWPRSSCPCQSLWHWILDPLLVFSSRATPFVNIAFEFQLKKHQKHLLFSVWPGTHTTTYCSSTIIPPSETQCDLWTHNTPPGFVKNLHNAADRYSQIWGLGSSRQSWWREWEWKTKRRRGSWVRNNVASLCF